MKSLVIAGILFILTVIFVAVNFFVINNFLSETEQLLNTLPFEIKDQNDEAAALDILNKTQDIWDKMETYISVALEHRMRREFIQEFTRTKGYLQAGMYDDYSASIELLSSMIEYIKFNEGISFGNIM